MPLALIIDDEPNIRRMVGALLVAEGFEVRDAADGASGVATAVQSDPDVVLLDLMMPGVDGWEVLKQLRAADATRSVPIVIITSHAITPDEREALGGVFAIVPKQQLARATLAPVVQAAHVRDDHTNGAAPLPL